jgi:hypothetical protein
MSSDLQAVEAAPRDTHHPHFSGTPKLTGNPGNHFQRVLLFLRQVFVHQLPIGIAATTHIDADACIAMAGKVLMDHPISDGNSIRFAVRQIFQNCRDRALCGVCRHPNTSRQADPSASVIDVFLIVRTGRGKDTTVAYLGNVFKKELPN